MFSFFYTFRNIPAICVDCSIFGRAVKLSVQKKKYEFVIIGLGFRVKIH